MTTKRKANKFRVRGKDAAQPDAPAFAIPVAGDGDTTPDIQPQTAPKPKPADPNPNTVEAIRREGLTGRQLRMARRAAQHHNLPATSDYDAVRLLRDNGIDPFQRQNMLALVQPGTKTAVGKIDPVKLPQTVNASETLPSTDLEMEDPAAKRAREINEMQRDIARRRKRRITLLSIRLAFFVFLPTLIAGYYFYNIATPMYSTSSSFLIQQNEAQPAGGGGGLGGLIGGGQMATMQDSIAVQNYLTSEAAMIRLDDDHAFKDHFSGENIDPLSRLDDGATNADAYKIYKRNVKISYDPAEGIIHLEVIAATPDASVSFSNALIDYAEERVSNLTQRLREDQMKGARESFQEAELARQASLEEMVQLQSSLEVADPLGLISSIQGQITALETELTTLRIQLAEQLENRRPNQARVDALRGQIRRREERIAELQSEMTNTGSDELSAAEKQARLRVAEADFQTRDLMLQTALQNLETSRMAADRQARFLAKAVSPVVPDEPKYPRSFENTVLAFLIFGGIYLLISLTASILREQV